jgi:hypothetical protein
VKTHYREELVESFISESNGGISVFIACTEPKILNLSQSFSTQALNDGTGMWWKGVSFKIHVAENDI